MTALSFLTHLRHKPDPLSAAADLIRQADTRLSEGECEALYEEIAIEIKDYPELSQRWLQIDSEFAHYCFRQAAALYFTI